jgi:glucose/arabinose dehydrogenase
MEMRTLGYFGLAAVLFALLPAQSARAALAGLTRVASGLTAPVYITHAPGDRERLFIVENGFPFDGDNASASIKILNLTTGALEPTPFLTITGINTNSEGGLLGMAFHPDYFSTDINNPGRGKFYVNVTANDSDPNTPFSTYIREYSVSANPNIANESFRPILEFTQPQVNHNGGWIDFGPGDGYLYIMTGDGGGGYDNGIGHSALPDAPGNGQDITNNFLGKVLRVDVNGDDFPGDTAEALAKNYAIPPTNPFVGESGDDEIWAYGLRNPFRASFDRLTHDLWIGDVGQDDREEIDFQPAASTGGENYGWRLREGDIATPTPLGSPVGGPSPADYVPPVYSYTHPVTNVGPPSSAEFDGTVVTGGYVYRGPDPSLQGKYFFLDAGGSGGRNYWMVDANPFGTVTNIDSLMTPDTGLAAFPVSFGEDAVGNLYIAYIASSEVYRIATNQLLAGDFDSDGDVDQDDYAKWRASLGATNPNPASDGGGDTVFDAADYVAWRNNLGASVHAGASASATTPEPEASVLALIVTAAIATHARRVFGRGAN